MLNQTNSPFKGRAIEHCDTLAEYFESNSTKLIRRVTAGAHNGTSFIRLPKRTASIKNQQELRKLWWQTRLKGEQPDYDIDLKRQEINVVDICSGAGGLATGVKWACEAVGTRPVFQACIDVDRDALVVYRNNIRPLRAFNENIANLVSYNTKTALHSSGHTAATATLTNSELNDLKGSIDIVVAGPPCEGNSNFNNVTRRVDRRNELYVASVAFGIALEAEVVIVENVVSVKRASQDVVRRARGMLVSAGYIVEREDRILEASRFGTPQNRRRHFLIACKRKNLDFDYCFSGLECEPISTMEAIGDLKLIDPKTSFDQSSKLSRENSKRVRYLIENDLWNLPDSERPACHQSGSHSYPSVYGRIRPDEPVQTITTGFLSPGRGRFTHPNLPRGLTPHEGARLQGLPDDFQFSNSRTQFPSRSALSNLIGGAVPPQLGYVVGLVALSTLPSINQTP